MTKREQQAAAEECASIGKELIRALAHPYRVHALHILNQRVSSPKELSREVGCSVSTMAYHVNQLSESGFVELVREEPRRGATEHYYRGNRRAIFNDEEWVLVPDPIKGAIVGMELRVTGKLISESLGSGTFERRPDRHHSLHEAVVDEQGWTEAMKLLQDTMEKLKEIEGQAAERRHLGNTADEAVPLVVSIVGFERAADSVES